MTIINPNNMLFIPINKPTVTTVSKTPTSITYSITNTNSIEAKIFYEIGDDTPDANNITLAGGASQNVTISGLTENTSYILYSQAFTDSGYSLVQDYTEVTISSALYTFTSHTFTNAGVTGRFGPNLSQIRSAYTSQSWAQNSSYLNIVYQGVQEWTVPATGNYQITLSGAAGGLGSGSRCSGSGPVYRGFGRIIRGTISLTQGEVICLVVGQSGGVGSGGWNLGGGGASYVFRKTGSQLLFAAAGAGAGNQWTLASGQDGNFSTSGGNGDGSSPGSGGTNGNPGTGVQNGNYGSGGNATLSGDNASAGGGSFGNYGSSFQGGAASSTTSGAGGFGCGGGAASGSSAAAGGGGGGGYSGGGGGGSYTSCSSVTGRGGGGGSYGIVSITNQGVSSQEFGSINIIKL
jgi:hypothetical protein